jgi:SAM-dependent methyltransferase
MTAVAPRGYPSWYGDPWRGAFEERIRKALRPGVRILDLGPGRRPTLPPERRPEGTRYVALDRSAEELEAAPPGSYDDVVVADASARQAGLQHSFDLVVSWQALEHLRALPPALAAVHDYLVPGGRLVALVSGTFGAHAIANRVVPHALAVRLNHRLLGRAPESVFPAHYDRCWYSALTRLLAGWTESDVVPLYRAASYFAFSPALFRAYVAYERWARSGDHRNLATHYLIDARR